MNVFLRVSLVACRLQTAGFPGTVGFLWNRDLFGRFLLFDREATKLDRVLFIAFFHAHSALNPHSMNLARGCRQLRIPPLRQLNPSVCRADLRLRQERRRVCDRASARRREGVARIPTGSCKKHGQLLCAPTHQLVLGDGHGWHHHHSLSHRRGWSVSLLSQPMHQVTIALRHHLGDRRPSLMLTAPTVPKSSILIEL